MAAGDLRGPADLVGDPAGAVASAGPAAGASVGWGTVGAADPAGLASTTGTGEVATAAAAVATGTVVGVVGRCREVPVDNPEHGDRDCHNGNTCCRPVDKPLHGVPTYHTWYTELELTAVTVPAAAAAVGDATVESDSCSDLCSNHQ